MTKMQISRDEISKLADRLMARGTSVILEDQPQLQGDFTLAALVLRKLVENGMPVTSIEIDDLQSRSARRG